MQFLGLLTGGEGVDDVVQIAVHDLVEIVYRQADPVVGAAVLREVIGAYLLAAIPCSHLTGAVSVDGVLLLLLLLGQQAAAQDLQSLVLVLELAALVLALD